MSKEKKKKKSHALREIILGVIAISVVLFLAIQVFMPLFS
jgi:amino acid permease